MRKLTDFGLCVKTELLRRRETQDWLIGKIKEDTELFVDNGYLGKILRGERNPPKIIASICKILELDSPTDMAG